jgi:arsenate reductase-like glutaredoxin family protein
MEEYIKNRFDENRPFDVVRAEDFGGDLYEFYEPLEKLIRKVSGVDIAGSRPVFLIGGRGTGKTMVLRFLSLEMQLKDFMKNTLEHTKSIKELSSEEMKVFLDTKKFIGIYLRFRTTEYDSLKGDIAQFFKPYLSIKIAEEIFKILGTFKSSGVLSKEQEVKIVKYFIDQIKEPEPKAENTFIGALKLIRKNILSQFETIFEKSSYCSINEIKENCIIPVVISKNIIFGLPNFIFAELDFLREKNLFILIDELEYLDDCHKRNIGQLIKDSDETSVIFKVGSRYMPQILPVGVSSEVLQELHDFRKIDIPEALNAAHSGRKIDYSNLIKNILNKRLSKSAYFKDRGITDIEQLFPNLSIEDEAVELVKNREKHWEKFKTFVKQSKSEKEINNITAYLKYSSNPIIEKLNMLLYYRGKSPEEIKKMCESYLDGKNKQYTTLYQKNALNLLFQLCSDYRNKKKYVGIDVFIHLSSGIIRSAVELCNQALNTAKNFGYKPEEGKPVEIVYQDIGAKNLAELQYADITGIPKNLGLKVQDFINQIGTIFRELHLNRYLVEPEPTHFETDYSEIIKGKNIFDAALNYSYLQKKPPMDPKSPRETKKDDFLINRVFAPYFKISYRVRGRTYISASQICSLITGDRKEKNKIRKKIIQKNTRKEKPEIFTQSTLFDTAEVNNNEID